MIIKKLGENDLNTLKDNYTNTQREKLELYILYYSRYNYTGTWRDNDKTLIINKLLIINTLYLDNTININQEIIITQNYNWRDNYNTDRIIGNIVINILKEIIIMIEKEIIIIIHGENNRK